MDNINKKPIFLNLLIIRLPVTGVVSIIHRVSGVLLALSLPWILFHFELSLQHETSFQQVRQFFSSEPLKVLSIFLLWMLNHHLCAGVRFLLIDLDIGVTKPGARFSAWAASVCAVLMTVLISGYVIWLA